MLGWISCSLEVDVKITIFAAATLLSATCVIVTLQEMRVYIEKTYGVIPAPG